MRVKRKAVLAIFAAFGAVAAAGAAAWACAASGSPWIAAPDPQRVPVNQSIDVTGAQWAPAPVDLHYLAAATGADLGFVSVNPRSTDGGFAVRMSPPDEPGVYDIRAVQGTFSTAQRFEVTSPPGSPGNGTGTSTGASNTLSVRSGMPSGPTILATLPLPPGPVTRPSAAGAVTAAPADGAATPALVGDPIYVDVPAANSLTAAPVAQGAASVAGEAPAAAQVPQPSVASVTGDLWAPLKPGAQLPGLGTVGTTPKAASPTAIGGWLAVGLLPLLGAFSVLELRRRREMVAQAGDS